MGYSSEKIEIVVRLDSHNGEEQRRDEGRYEELEAAVDKLCEEFSDIVVVRL